MLIGQNLNFLLQGQRYTSAEQLLIKLGDHIVDPVTVDEEYELPYDTNVLFLPVILCQMCNNQIVVRVSREAPCTILYCPNHAIL